MRKAEEARRVWREHVRIEVLDEVNGETLTPADKETVRALGVQVGKNFKAARETLDALEGLANE